ncbi:MAG: glycosyltransferase family 4 protein [Candidatus Limnocylindrales bacterium]|nr:glycosyltransferase family 4 protein [Candidatus Limnocylindrales bacterium]
MNVCVAVEYRFVQLADGSVWTPNQYAWSFWRRYLDVFDHVRCLARLRRVDRVDTGWHRADGPGVSFDAVPHYVGPAQCLLRAPGVWAAVQQSIVPVDAYLLRVPGTLGTLAWRKLKQIAYPYGVEVLGDPYDVFAPGAVRHPLRPFLRWYTTRQLRLQCADACLASYVTEHTLQRRYPAGGAHIGASCIELSDDMFARAPRVRSAAGGPVRLIFVGSLEQYYKGPDLLIRAVAETIGRGLDLQLTIIGDGRLRTALERLAAEVGCANRVHFTGALSNAQVSKHLDGADLFVMPSRTEGLPRAMIEAMARGLPCIGSDAGGIPELLAPEAIVPRGNLQALVDRICEVVTNTDGMRMMSARNLRHARSYRADALQRRRVEFYRGLKDITERRLRGELAGIGSA